VTEEERLAETMGIITEMQGIIAEMQASVVQLTANVTDLTGRQAQQIKANEDSLAQTDRALRLTQTGLRWTAIGLLVDVVLTFGVGWLIRDAQSRNDDLDRQQRSIRILASRTSVDALCPLYDLFLDTYDPTNPQAVKIGRKEYDKQYVVIERGATVLNCAHRTRGKDD
jgi:hypothetical protein